MTLRSTIKDGQGAGHLAGVSSAGELIVGGFPGATPSFQNMSVANAAFNFFGPKAGFNLIITAIIFSSTAGPVINIYEAPSPTSLTVDKTLINLDLPGNGVFVIPFPFGGFLEVTEGEYVNAVTAATTIRMTIIGFYRPVMLHPSL